MVAEEVRSLALRSKEDANKTEELIRQSVKEAGEGESTAHHVGEQLAVISTSVSKASDIVAEIAVSARERVSKAVSQVGQVTQQNAANSEESSSAAELSGQSEELAAMVQTFAPAGRGGAAPNSRAALKPARKQRLLAAPAAPSRSETGRRLAWRTRSPWTTPVPSKDF